MNIKNQAMYREETTNFEFEVYTDHISAKKRCCKCKTFKELTCFHNNFAKNKLQNVCKECRKLTNAKSNLKSNAKRYQTDNKTYSVYKIEIDGYTYIGSTSLTLPARMAAIASSAKRAWKNNKIGEYIREHNLKPSELLKFATILQSCNTEEIAIDCENRWMEIYMTTGKCTNLNRAVIKRKSIKQGAN